ncbi:MAG: hypothetical protein J6S67_12725 [Methanobrevibacter sp.]|nr:hypothetical protein [Methanobrevibacter sp.]
MKLIIDIPEENYKEMCEYGNERVDFDLKRMIQNGTPIPDNATNGDVIKAIFDTTEEHFYMDYLYGDEDRMVNVYGLDRSDDPATFYADWWNALYQKGGKRDV